MNEFRELVEGAYMSHSPATNYKVLRQHTESVQYSKSDTILLIEMKSVMFCLCLLSINPSVVVVVVDL